MIVQINGEHPQPREIRRVVERLREDAVVAYPTDTVYAIGANLRSTEGIERLRRLVGQAKGEPDHTPLSFICESLSQVAEYAHVDDEAYRLLRDLLPGPFTLILRAKRNIPAVMRRRRETVGVRIPEAPIPRAIVEQLGNPLVTTSAVTDEGEPIADPWTLEDLYDHLVDLVIDGGYVTPEPSTVIDLTGDVPELVRQGKGQLDGQRHIDLV